jgi:uncharacterized protein YceK
MMRLTLVILALCGIALSGCGTFSDGMYGSIDEHVYYRGVRYDVHAATEGGLFALMAIDTPLSAVADTLLVPAIVYFELTDPAFRMLVYPPCPPSIDDLVPMIDEETKPDTQTAESVPQGTPNE